METLLKFVSSHLMKDQKFEVSNSRKIILVIGLTGSGKSSFVNFITGKNLCKVSSKPDACTKDYKMVDLYYNNKVFYFVDTPGLDDAEGDKENIEAILKFRNTVPRINAIIYCQKITENRFNS